MKTLILSTIAAAAIALSAGTALANDSNDNGFVIYLQSQHQPAPQRSFLSGSDYADPDQGVSSNAKDAREFRKAQAATGQRSFLSGSDAVDPDQGLSDNAKDAREFRKVQGE